MVMTKWNCKWKTVSWNELARCFMRSWYDLQQANWNGDAGSFLRRILHQEM